MAINLDIVYVNFHKERDIICSIKELKILLKKCKIISKIFVVDNSFELNNKKSQELKIFCEKNSEINQQIKYCPSRKNLGFGKGNNKAARISNSDKILFVNCDTKFFKTEAEDFLKFINLIDDKNVIAGPKVISERNIVFDSCFSFDPFLILFKPLRHIKFIGKFSKLILMSKYLNNKINEISYFSKNKNQLSYVDWVSGCFMIVQRKFFEKCRGFDERYFLYFDDVDICRKARNLNLNVIYDPNVSIIHNANHESRNTKGILKSIFFNKASRYHLSSWIKYLFKWRIDFISRIFLSKFINKLNYKEFSRYKKVK